MTHEGDLYSDAEIAKRVIDGTPEEWEAVQRAKEATAGRLKRAEELELGKTASIDDPKDRIKN